MKERRRRSIEMRETMTSVNASSSVGYSELAML